MACDCEVGCPACVGPRGESRLDGRALATRLLRVLVGAADAVVRAHRGCAPRDSRAGTAASQARETWMTSTSDPCAARAWTGCEPQRPLDPVLTARSRDRSLARIEPSDWPRPSVAGSWRRAGGPSSSWSAACRWRRGWTGWPACRIPSDPRQPLVLIDTETTGLGTGAGTLPFLVGIGRWHGDTFVTRQLLLPEQSDEAGFLDAVADLIPADACLVTYNGRTFDWPLLVTRFRLHGRSAPAHAAHLDLLPLARALWRHRLAMHDWRASRLSSAAYGGAHDLPGGLVPARYLDYLRSGHGGLLREVLEHNHQDVVSMALLLRVLAMDLAPAAPRATRRARWIRGTWVGLGASTPGAGATRRHWLASTRPWSDWLMPGMRSATKRSPSTAPGRSPASGCEPRPRAPGTPSRWRAVVTPRWPGSTWPSTVSMTVMTYRPPSLPRIGRAPSRSAAGSSDAVTDVVERDLARRVPRLRRRLGGAISAV